MVNNTGVQNYLARRAAEMLSKRLKTKVAIQHVRIDFLNHFLLQGLYIEDQSHDTLLYAGEAQVRITDWFIFKDKPTLHYLALQNTYVHLNRSDTSKDWNYKFVADGFSTKSNDTTSKPFKFDLQKVEFENVRFHMDDHWVGENLDFDFGSLLVKANSLDFDKRVLDVADIDAGKAAISVNEYKGGRPRKPGKAFSFEDAADFTPFNSDKWNIKAAGIKLTDCTFRLTENDKTPPPDVFDENHLVVTNINISVSNGSIVGDTIHGNIDHMSAHERCGLTVKDMHAKVTVSPIASICENLYLETNYSKVQDYYAMHYRHFPDFTEYIDSVTMVAHVKDAVVDERDIAYFAPQLRQLPQVVLRVSGDGKGTVANLGGQHLHITDGSTTISGNATMKGLPDIYKTYITWTDGQMMTSGKGILLYAPGLKNSPNIDLEKLAYAYFKGKYEGYIENFSVTGSLNTNLGNITTNLKLNIPGFNANTAVYSGDVTADAVQIGPFLRQSLFGSVTLNEKFSGSSFNPDNVQLNVEGTVKQLVFKGYPYQNIMNHGTLAKKQFTGTLLVDDPNLALEFDGGFNYENKDVEVKATAHVLGSNFAALGLTRDTITLTGDFDLDCNGSNIDNFTGYAKLNNIDLRRNAHKLAVDSILAVSEGDSINKTLTISSNDVTATIKGTYQLSKLGTSIQYYLSRYIPNYIAEPEKFAPAQNFSFTLKTLAVDSILAVTIPFMRGFDSSTFSGSLNTTAKKLTLNANVPFGTIGSFHMTNIAVNGSGDLDMIGVTASVDNVSVGDSILNSSLSVTTTMAHDSVAFTVATTTPDTSSAITLNGQIIARKDSLFLTVLPSQFFLNQVKWDIAGGSKIVYSKKFLQVQGFSITSGLQKITAATQLENGDQSLVINTENLDLGQFGSWAGFASYQPDGRVNGSVRIDKIFDNFYVSANIKATNVQLGADTIGTINLIGNYNGGVKTITFDPQTGIYRGEASATVGGIISYDSSTNEKLDCNIQLNNAPTAWAQPFLLGIMSRLGGVMNGSINFSGTSSQPQIAGDATLTGGALRLDYMGCNYTIPTAHVLVNNKRIELGEINIYDSKKRKALLTGHFSHQLFKDWRMHIKLQSDGIEAMNLSVYDNSLFYGDLVAGMDSLRLDGRFNNMRLTIAGAHAAAKSHIYIPESTGADVGTYSYVSFKNYGKPQDKLSKKTRDKFHIFIDANVTPDVEMIIIPDPSTGDQIRTRGSGHIQMDVPPDNDISTNGVYTIESGTYNFSLPQLAIRRDFVLQNESTISFNGPFSTTHLDVDAIYRVKAKLSDLFSEADRQAMASDISDATTPQWVDVILHMSGSLLKPSLTFKMDLEDKHSQNTVAYQRLKLINNDPRQQFAQVGSLLLIGQFIPPEGVGSGTAISGAVNNFSQLISASASTGLTTILNKLTRDKDLNVAVSYTNYNYSDVALGGMNRSQVKVDVNKSYLNDRLLVELGSTSDWGRPTSTSQTSGFNLTGDFRVQYQIAPGSNLRLNAFRTSDYDVTLDRDIVRSGVGMSWRKSFDNLTEFFHGKKYFRKQQETLRRQLEDTTHHTPPTK